MAAPSTAYIEDADDPGVGCIVVTGNGQSFCAGADRRIMLAAADPGDREARAALADIHGCFVALGNAAVPSVAVVRGWAIGAGLNPALAADLRVVARDAQLLSGFARLGTHPGAGTCACWSAWPAATPRPRWRCSTSRSPALGAVALGLAFTAVPGDEVERTALELAATPGRARAGPAHGRHAARRAHDRGVDRGGGAGAAAQLRSLEEGDLTF